MNSHTIPKKLLEQFAFFDPNTQSNRLWCYEKGIPPYPGSPKSATRLTGYFADQANPAREAELESRLKQEFEDPVNEFIEALQNRTFVMDFSHVRALTGYVTTLFNRSLARRAAVEVQRENQLDGLRGLAEDEEKIGALLSKFRSRLPSLEVTKEILLKAIQKQLETQSGTEQLQARYLQAMEMMMAYEDEGMLKGDWGFAYADMDLPFVIGDAPVVTWERLPNNELLYGQGFSKPDVEILLPVASTACLHILPRVPRRRPVRLPTVTEVNLAQAAFATRKCFAAIRNDDLHVALQARLGECRLGIEGFALNHIDYKQMIFDILMNSN